MPPMSHRMNPNMKAKLDFRSLAKIISYSKRLLPMVIVAVVLGIGFAVSTIAWPKILEGLMDTVTAGIWSPAGVDMKQFVSTAITLLVILAVGGLASFAQQLLMAEVAQRTSRKLRTDINLKLNRLPLSYYDSTSTGEILSRITNDVDTISQTFGSSIAELSSALILFVGVTIMMFTVNWILALVTIGSAVIGFIGTTALIGQSQKYFSLRQKNIGSMNEVIEEVYSNHRVVKAFGGQRHETARFESINGQLYKNNKMAQFLSGTMMPIMGFAGNLAYAAVFVVGVALSINGMGVTFGTIISFTIYARLFSRPLSSFAQSLSTLQQAGAASTRVFELIDTAEMPDESGKKSRKGDVLGNVCFDHVNFSYNAERTIISDFSADLKAGMKVAIVGPTGAGKTTMVNLLMRFYDVCGGDIRIDGVSINDYRREDVRDMFDMILQDTWLIAGTVRENLVFNKKDVSEQRLDEVCQAVGLEHFIAGLPNGYDTKIDESLSLSEGQKQQLTIARAMIKDSPLLILDEATSSVDTRTELHIQQAMDELTKGRTSFVIAHRLSTIRNADIILVMRDGDIVEQGSHKELLAKNGFYASLYNAQFEAVD